MREQTVTPRAGRGGSRTQVKGHAGDIVIVQQPAPRRGGTGRMGAKQGAVKGKRRGWRRVLVLMPALGKVLLAVCAGLVLFRGYRAAASSEFFELKSVDVSGTARASDEQIAQIVRRATAAGVWKADLASIGAEIERQPWVRTAVVSRVLPSGLRVRVTERTPRAVVRTDSGRFVWVDEDAVMVGTLAPSHPQPAFFMRGWDESGAGEARAANRERVGKFLELVREFDAAGLSARVSEVNLDDMRDVRVQLAGDDSQIEVRLGREEWTKRLVQALEALDEQRQTPRGSQITYIDMTQSKRAVLGFKSGAGAPGGDGPATDDVSKAGVSTVGAVASDAAANERVAGGRKSSEKSSRPSGGAKRKTEQKSNNSDGGAGDTMNRARGGAERPRRVGGEGER